MRDVLDETQAGTNRRTFIKKGIVTAAGATVGAGLLADIPRATAAQGGGLNRGDAAILDRKSTRLNSSHLRRSRMPSSA